MRFRRIAISWAPPIRGKRRAAPFGPILRKASTRTPCTAPIHRRPRPRKSAIFFLYSTFTHASASAPMTANLLGLDNRQLQAFCSALGEKPYRAKQLMRWIHHVGVDNFRAMTDVFKSLRE